MGNFKATQRRVLAADAQAAASAERFLLRNTSHANKAQAKAMKHSSKVSSKGSSLSLSSSSSVGKGGAGLVAATGGSGNSDGGSGGGMQDDDSSSVGTRGSTLPTADGPTFTLPGGNDDDGSGSSDDDFDDFDDSEDDDEDVNKDDAADDSDDDLVGGGGGGQSSSQGTRKTKMSKKSKKSKSSGGPKGLGRKGWLAPGTFVTLHLAPVQDKNYSSLLAEGELPPSSSSVVTFAADAAAFNALAAAHGGAHGSSGCAAPMSLHALHRHENRLTLLNCQIQRAQPLFLPEGNK
jgi:hypothetical protein